MYRIAQQTPEVQFGFSFLRGQSQIMVRVSLLACTLVGASASAGTFGTGFTIESTRLREQLLQGYDRRTPPTAARAADANTTSAYGTDVSLQVRFFKVQEVAPNTGTMRVKVWVREQWVDPRLSWDPANHDGVDKLYFWTDTRATSDNTEIWLPDLQVYNSHIAMTDTVDPAYARVHSDGTVFFSRPGTLDVMCKFSGLVAFPFDMLKCKVEFGGWILSGGHQGVSLLGSGFEFSPQEATSGSSYQEYSIMNVSVQRVNYQYACCPNEPWPAILYTLSLGRARSFYVYVIILPTISITILSFAVFWLPSVTADALSYGLTILVVVILMQVVMINMLPVCEEPLWIYIFVLSNTSFCMFSLFESCLCIVIENLESEMLVPQLSMFCPGLAALLGRFARSPKVKADSDLAAPDAVRAAAMMHFDASIAGVFYRQFASVASAGEQSHGYRALRRGQSDLRSLTPKTPVKASPVGDGTATPGGGGGAPSLRPALRDSSQELSDDDRYRLTYFERLFFKMDADRSGTINAREAEMLLSFAALDMTYSERKESFRKADFVGADAQLNRLEFMDLCTYELWNVPIPQIELAVENANAVRESHRNMIRAKWRRIAEQVDAWSARTVPFLYGLSQILIFNLDLTDDYDQPGKNVVMGTDAVHVRRYGRGSATGMGMGVASLIVYIAAIVLCVVASYLMRSATKRFRKTVLEKELQNFVVTMGQQEASLGDDLRKERRQSMSDGTANMLRPSEVAGRDHDGGPYSA